MFHTMGKSLLILGIVLAAMGLLMMLADRVPGLGRLPGDIVIRKKNVTIYVPIATSVILSLILTFILWWAGRK